MQTKDCKRTKTAICYTVCFLTVLCQKQSLHGFVSFAGHVTYHLLPPVALPNILSSVLLLYCTFWVISLLVTLFCYIQFSYEYPSNTDEHPNSVFAVLH